MAAITQPRAGVPYTGRRYGFVTIPPIVIYNADFLHGSLSVRPYVSGNVNVASHVSGEIAVECMISGRVEVNK